MIEDFMKANISAYELLDYFKEHPCISPYIRGTEPVEYSAHMIPEENYENLPSLVSDGLILVGDAAGLINNSFHHEGTNLAMASGVAAAETIIEAKKKNDFSAKMLSLYKKKLEESFALKDMKHYNKFFEIVSNNKRFLNLYPKLFVDNMIEYFTIDERPKEEIKRKIIKDIRSQVNYISALQDLYKIYKYMM